MHGFFRVQYPALQRGLAGLDNRWFAEATKLEIEWFDKQLKTNPNAKKEEETK
jgi:hypothetical protein